MAGDPVSMSDGIVVERNGPSGHQVVRGGADRVRVERMMSPEERARAKVRPVRHEYRHDRCGLATRMGQGIAETFAVDPSYYATTYCVHCSCYFPVIEFKWVPDGSQVGS